MDRRPPLTRQLSPRDFRDFYWLKAELLDFCRREGLSTAGGKPEVTDRIAHYLATGERRPPAGRRRKPTSTFDWAAAPLTPATVITDNYRNTEHVRAFFTRHLGKSFAFNVTFMRWMRANPGKTLADALTAWRDIRRDKEENTAPKNIDPQFEYNRYLRDFLADNPGADRKLGIRLWRRKKARRGGNAYAREDFDLPADDAPDP